MDQYFFLVIKQNNIIISKYEINAILQFAPSCLKLILVAALKNKTTQISLQMIVANHIDIAQQQDQSISLASSSRVRTARSWGREEAGLRAVYTTSKGPQNV